MSSVLDVDIAEEDAQLLSSDRQDRAGAGGEQEQEVKATFAAEAFRAYDIRGLSPEHVNTELANTLGKALGTRVLEAGFDNLFVAKDGRITSPELFESLTAGVLSTGCDVIDLGLVPSPLLYFAIATDEQIKCGVIITASHNGANHNGFKMTLDGKPLADDGIQSLKRDMELGNFQTGQGEMSSRDITDDYIDAILSDVALMGVLKVVVDAGNGATADIAPQLLEELGCEVVPLNCTIDGNFPSHEPDPSNPENLQQLINAVKEEEADLGFAFDGDGDRIAVVTASGQIISADRLMMLFAKDIVSRNPGADVIFDVKCTRQLSSLISSYGGRPIMWKTGHAHIKSKMIETDALLGGEYSGHIFIKDRWYGFDDGMFAAARLLEIMSLREQDLDSIFESFPALPASPEIRIPVAEEEKFEVIERLVESGDFQSGKSSTIDGLRVEFAKGWGLIRASNTGPELTLRFEGDSEDVIDQLKALFKREIAKVAKDLTLDF
nr:phosphomannomutase/phosphoglucomutase [Marinibactrum halimedae]